MNDSPSMPRSAARAIVVHDGNLLVMKRNKHGSKYMTLIGGRMEPGEEPEETVLREVTEETGLELFNPMLVFIEQPSQSWGMQYIFLCNYKTGEPRLSKSSDEYQSTLAGLNTYEPCWVPIKDFMDHKNIFRTERLRQEIITALSNGFPAAVKQWTP